MQNYIPYNLRLLITQVDPRLDYKWEENLAEIFSKLGDEEKDNIDKQILRNKQINWNPDSNTFSFKHISSLDSLKNDTNHAGMKTLIQKIMISLNQLNQYVKVTEIADYLESILKQIDNIDVEENIDLQRTKKRIRMEFIYEAATVIKNKKNLEIPENFKNLSIESLKCFILEVFLKHQLLNFWFKTLRPRQLNDRKESIINQFLKHEQRIRQLEIVQTSMFIYAIAPSRNQDINPFSIRRFLNEEKMTLSNNVYLNAAIIPIKKLGNVEFENSFKWQVSRIVTIEKQLSTLITDLVDSFELTNSNILLPLLFKPLDSSGFATDKIAQQRLWDFEQQLSLRIFEPLEHALRHLVTNQEEHDFLYVSLRQIMGDINSYYKDFQQQPALMFDNYANLFSARLIAYLTLIEKRKNDLFILQSNEDYQSNLSKLSEPINILRRLAKDSLDTMRTLRMELKEAQNTLKQKENSFLSKFFNKHEKHNEKIETLRRAIYEHREHTYFEIVRIPKKYQTDTVYLEFESLISINDLERHYAFTSGQNWVRRLPILVQLPEDRNLFNIQEIYNTLEFDLSKMNQKWTDAA